jgi:hypothetical protein
MSTLSLQLPESLHRAACELAGKEGVPVEQLAAVALAEKVSALQTLDYLRERAARGHLEDFDQVLALVPDSEVEHEGDRLP